MNEIPLKRQIAQNIATLTMNTPENLNALSDEMLQALQDAFDEIAQLKDIRAVIIRGAGKAFCAGHDLRELTNGRQAEDGGHGYFVDVFKRCTKMMTTIRALPQPVIAQVHGIATAAGCQLVASCDMAVAASGTRFGVNGVNIGLFCSTPMVALSRNVPTKKAFEMLTTGDFVQAEEARDIGLINRVVPLDLLETETRALAQTVASKLGAAVKIGKHAYYRQLEMNIQDAYTFTGDVMAENLLFEQTIKGLDAFMNKRPPEWDQ